MHPYFRFSAPLFSAEVNNFTHRPYYIYPVQALFYVHSGRHKLKAWNFLEQCSLSGCFSSSPQSVHQANHTRPSFPLLIPAKPHKDSLYCISYSNYCIDRFCILVKCLQEEFLSSSPLCNPVSHEFQCQRCFLTVRKD